MRLRRAPDDDRAARPDGSRDFSPLAERASLQNFSRRQHWAPERRAQRRSTRPLQRKLGITTIFVTHGATISDRIVVMNAGCDRAGR